MSFSIADLPVVDDLNVPVDPTEYQDQASPAPIAPGTYRFTIVKVEPKTTKEGALVLDDGKYPVLKLAQVKVVEPVENARGVGLFQDIKTKPGTRKNSRGADVAFNQFYDFVRAFDAETTIEGFEHAKQLFQGFVDSNGTFVAQLGWEAYDKEYVDQEFGKLNKNTYDERKTVAKDVANAIYNKARKKTKDFIVNGKRQASIAGGVEGSTLEARPVIQRFYPTHVNQQGVMVPNPELAKENLLGPFKR